MQKIMIVFFIRILHWFNMSKVAVFVAGHYSWNPISDPGIYLVNSHVSRTSLAGLLFGISQGFFKHFAEIKVVIFITFLQPAKEIV